MFERQIFLFLIFSPTLIFGANQTDKPSCIRRPYFCTPKNEAKDCCGNRCVPLITPSVSQKTIYTTLNFVGSSGESDLDLTLLFVCSEEKIGSKPSLIRGGQNELEKYLTVFRDAGGYAYHNGPTPLNKPQPNPAPSFPEYEYNEYPDSGESKNNPSRIPPAGSNAQFQSKWPEFGGHEFGPVRRPGASNRQGGGFGGDPFFSRPCQNLRYQSERFGDSCPVYRKSFNKRV